MKRVILSLAIFLLFLPSMSTGSPNVQNSKVKVDKPGVSKIARGMTVSFDKDGVWCFFAGFKSRRGCANGYETITVFQYNTKNILSVKPGVYKVWTRIIKSSDCSFNVKDKNFADGDEAGQWFGVIYGGTDLGISPETHLVACGEDVVYESFDGFLQRAICADVEN